MPSLIRISEAASIALHAAMILALDEGKTCSTRAIAATLRVSDAHLSKVLQRLTRVGLVTPVRGPKGGFRLGRDAGTITLLDVYEAIEGPIQPHTCLLERPICEGQCCIVGSLLKQVDAVRDRLEETTLAQAVEHLHHA